MFFSSCTMNFVPYHLWRFIIFFAFVNCFKAWSAIWQLTFHLKFLFSAPPESLAPHHLFALKSYSFDMLVSSLGFSTGSTVRWHFLVDIICYCSAPCLPPSSCQTKNIINTQILSIHIQRKYLSTTELQTKVYQHFI